MKDIAIVIARSKGALDAVVEDSGYRIIPGTEQEFRSLDTYAFASNDASDCKKFGHINTLEDTQGWIAFAQYSE